MKNLTEDIIASFKQRIKETEERAKKNEELVTEVQKTLDGFQKDHQEMAAVLKANAASLREKLALGEKDRLDTYNNLMSAIHNTIGTIEKEVSTIQSSTLDLLKEFRTKREQMAGELEKMFAQSRADLEQNEKTRMQNEKIRIEEFDAMMKNIGNELKSINDEVQGVFKYSEDLLKRFEKERLEMSTELKSELGKNLSERVAYTRSLLSGFQARLSEISSENQQMADKLRKELGNSKKDLLKGDAERLKEFKVVMNGIHTAIKAIDNEVKEIQKAASSMVDDFSQDRKQASIIWDKMEETIAQLKKKGDDIPKKEKKETTKEKSAETAKEKITKAEPKPVASKTAVKKEKAQVEQVSETKVKPKPEPEPKTKPAEPITMEEKILDYINSHPEGVRVSEMEAPLGETRMKLGYIAKHLLDAGKVQKVDNTYFPLK